MMKPRPGPTPGLARQRVLLAQADMSAAPERSPLQRLAQLRGGERAVGRGFGVEHEGEHGGGREQRRAAGTARRPGVDGGYGGDGGGGLTYSTMDRCDER